jgi:hypothetical protein
MRFNMQKLLPAMLLLTGLRGIPLCAEEAAPAEFSCTSTNIVAVPSRPTVSNATDTTHCGVVELEYGLQRQWPGAGANRDDLTGGLRMGLTRKLDFHYASSTFLHLMNGDGDRTGFGDTFLSLKYRFLEQGTHRPALGLYYSTKVPTASVVEGLGSGEFDHALSLLASKDLHPVHFDFNFTPFFAGRPGRPGFDHNCGFALAAWAPLLPRLNVAVEGYGASSLNVDSPAFGSTTLAFSYALRPRVVLDTGLDVGVTAGAPRKRVFAGVTYAAGNVYSLFRKPR